MSLRIGFLFVTLLAGSIAFPLEDVEQDMSIFFETTDLSGRIVGGTTAGTVPWMVALTTGGNVRNMYCGGSLLNNRHVLTAAHCISGSNMPGNLRGHVGTNRFASGGTSYTFSRRIMHPNYNSNQIKNDIGILVTSSNVAMSGSVGTVSISSGFVGGGVATTVNGWGGTSTSGSGAASQVLLELRPNTMEGNACAQLMRTRAPQVNMNAPPVNPTIEICTFLAAGRGTCRGDSGSALVRRGTNQQIGVVSWGLPCARGAPDIYVRVSAFVSWIQQNS